MIRIGALLFVCFMSCQSSTPQKKSDIKKTDAEGVDTVGFFHNCSDLISHSSLGSLQGVKANSDSIKNLYFADCFDCKETFQIIFVHKDSEKRQDKEYDSLSSEFHGGCSVNFKNFNCFAFIYPMRDPDKQKNVHAMNMSFPLIVKVYERISDDNWKFVKRSIVKTFEEFSELRFKTIYHLD
jgi:hypothetical protein